MKSEHGAALREQALDQKTIMVTKGKMVGREKLRLELTDTYHDI